MKFKIFAIYTCLLVLLALILIFGFYFYNKSTKAQLLIQEEEVIENNKTLNNDIAIIINKEKELEVELRRVKDELSKTIEDYKSIKQNAVAAQVPKNQDDYIQIMLALSVIEAKLYRGGSIKNDIVRLKGLTIKISDLFLLTKNFEEVVNLISRKDMKESYEDYVKIAKSELLKKQTSKFAKIMSIVSKYLTILNTSQVEDKMLIQLGEYLNNDDFISAYAIVSRLNIESVDAESFVYNLKSASLVQAGINDIYFAISNKLNEGEKLVR